MEYITSRRFRLPESAHQFGQEYWFNLWRTSLWPYKELVAGDTLYWYETPSRHIVWKSRVAQVERFPYSDKGAVRARLETAFGDVLDVGQPYFVEGADHGFCLAYRVVPVERLALAKPDGMVFPQQGWLRVDDDIARRWLNQSAATDEAVLDDAAMAGALPERLRRLNAVMANVRPERVRSLVSQTLRRDSPLVGILKELCGYRCQYPGCGVRIPKRGGGFYVEVHHVEPVRRGGQSVLGNLIVLCPNHHAEFDYGDVLVLEQTVEHVRGSLNGIEFDTWLPTGEAG